MWKSINRWTWLCCDLLLVFLVVTQCPAVFLFTVCLSSYIFCTSLSTAIPLHFEFLSNLQLISHAVKLGLKQSRVSAVCKCCLFSSSFSWRRLKETDAEKPKKQEEKKKQESKGHLLHICRKSSIWNKRWTPKSPARNITADLEHTRCGWCCDLGMYQEGPCYPFVKHQECCHSGRLVPETEQQ